MEAGFPPSRSPLRRAKQGRKRSCSDERSDLNPIQLNRVEVWRHDGGASVSSEAKASMTKFHRQSLVAYGEPLCETVADLPTPCGSEVLLRVECCGVCHSDLHIQDGYFDLGGGRQLDITKDRTLPFTLGHEIAGTIEAIGEAAGDAADGAVIGHRVAVYPWIGCGKCAACR